MSLSVRRLIAALSVTIAVLISFDAGAQQRERTRGWSLYPSAQVGAVYDDNLLFRRTQSKQNTIFSRYGATLSANHQGARSSFRSSYGFTGESFTGDNEDLSEPLASQRATLGTTVPIGARGALNASASYHLSRRPDEVFDPVGIELGRRRAQGYTGSLGYTRQISATNSFGAQYSYGFRQLQAATIEVQEFESTHQSASANWGHTLSLRTAGTLRYQFRIFEGRRRGTFPGSDEPLGSHVVTYGVNRQVSSRASLDLYAGPNFYENFILDELGETILGKEWTITPEAGASFRYSWQDASISISYGRTQNQFVGRGGRVTTDRLSFSLGFQPARNLSVNLSPSAQRNTQTGRTFDTFRTTVSAALQIRPWWALNANYNYSYQERFFGLAGEEIDLEPGGRSRNRAYIGIVIGKTVPLE